MDAFVDIDGVEPEYILFLLLLFLLGVSFLVWVRFEVVVDDGGEGSISDGRGDFLSALDAGVLFGVDQFGEAPPAKAMVAGLDGYWNAHDLVTEGAGDLLLEGLGKLA
jgi:hypothetical protein